MAGGGSEKDFGNDKVLKQQPVFVLFAFFFFFYLKFPEETEARILRYKLLNFLTQEVLRIIIRK